MVGVRKRAIFAKIQYCIQSHHREVLRWDLFMEHELRFVLDLGRLALLKKKKIWADYEQLFRPVFSSFHGQKKRKKLNEVKKNLKKL